MIADSLDVEQSDVAQNDTEPMQIGVVIVTHNAKHHLDRCLRPLLASPLQPRVLVVDSGSSDGTVEHAASLGAETLILPRDEFNHGLTRERARRHLGTAITVFMTPDAYPTDAGFIARLTQPLREGRAEIAYGRQLARDDADLLERMGREFNYPGRSHVRVAGDWPAFGSYTHFCSNACAAWWTPALDAVGGFKTTLVSEETVATAEILSRGGRIAYVAEAVVEHSHRQTLKDAFQRQFDVGFTRAMWQELLISRERDEVRGRQFATTVLRHAWRRQRTALPGLVARFAAMWLGYRAGLLGQRLPDELAKTMSGQDYYWTSTVRPVRAETVAA